MFNSLPKVYDSYEKRQDATDRIMGNLSTPSSSFDHKNWTEEQKESIRILLTNMVTAIDKNSNSDDIDREITNIKRQLERPTSPLRSLAKIKYTIDWPARHDVIISAWKKIYRSQMRFMQNT